MGNRERITQNNQDLAAIKTTVQSLPDYVDTSDANATASDILPNKTAYVDGIKITGTATSDANATATDIASGKTAYVDGVKVTGTASGSADLNEYFGNTMRSYSVENNRRVPLLNIVKKLPDNINFIGTTFKDLFKYCTALEEIDLSTWTISSITSMENMCTQCAALTSVNFGNMSQVPVTNMHQAFSGCNNLETIEFNNFSTTSALTNLNSCFANCTSLETLDVSGFNTSNVDTLNSCFKNCLSLTLLDISSWEFSNVTDHTLLFNGVPADCTIYVKDQAAVDTLTSWDSSHTYTIKPA